MVTRVQMTGLKELGEAMTMLSTSIAKKVAFQGVLAGASVIRKSAKQKAPVAESAYIARAKKGDSGVVVQPGNIAKNIVNKRIKSNLTAEYIVTVRGKRKDGYAARAGRLMEFGTVKMSATPWLRPAYDENKEKAAQAIKDKLAKAIEKANSKK